MMNNGEISTEPIRYKDFLKSSNTDEDINSKLKQIKEVTNCNEEQGILILHDCNYNVEFAINKILTLSYQNDCEWKTKKGKQKKIQTKIKEIEKNDPNNNSKDDNYLTNKTTTIDKAFVISEIPHVKNLNQDSYNNGKTFRNYNLSKKQFSVDFNYNNVQQFKPTILDLDCKWNGKSIIVENQDFLPMQSIDFSIAEVKTKSIERSIEIQPDSNSKGDQMLESSIMFKTHCSTKPPPKVQYSLATPVQIMNKNISQRLMPKLKFGDTDFYDNADIESIDNNLNIISSNNDMISQPSIINVEDNSIIKVGPTETHFIEQSPNYSMPNSIFNQGECFPQKNLTQSSLGSINKMSDFPKCADQYFDNFGYVNQFPVGNPMSCNNGFQSIGSYNSPNINNIKDIVNHSKAHEVFLNQSHSNTYPSQSNINHPKSTIYLVPNMMMNPMNALYMTVANPLPTSALSPPMPPIQAQYNVQQPTQSHNHIYFDESQIQADDQSNRIKRQLNRNPPQLPNNRIKKAFGEMTDDFSLLKHSEITRGTFKGLPNFSQNQLSKSVSLNYSPQILLNYTPQNRPQLISNPLNRYPCTFSQPVAQQHDLNSFENNRKRNMSIQNNNFGGKSWS